ncbi:hypothetical protein RIF29_35889 [Crotalaria pallida]|uniref:Dof zinc finger protein n=1 Tax=Crotalaria pallida TaxID=3830 RepID=A0AAN9HRZ4_CROPI
MLTNCDKMVHIPPPTTNEWTQQAHDIDDHKVSMASASSSSTGIRVMEKPGQELLQQQQQALKCPRCDSSNTKFCYYNNYSLSQPRHFCKACKRYWTRGGTLRNVPVGGGCRKNKRVKRPNIDTTTSSSPSPSSNSNPPSSQPHIENNNIVSSTTTSNHINPLFYGLPSSNSCDIMSAIQFPRFSSSGYDLHQPQMNSLGLGFSSDVMSGDNGYRNNNGFISSNNNNTLLSTYSSIFGSSSTTSAPSASVMASLLLQQKFMNGGVVKDGSGSNNNYHGLVPLEGLQMEGTNNNAEMGSKEVKAEAQNKMEWNNISGGGGSCQNQMDQQHMGLLSDPSLYWNTATAMGAWSDQPNINPSVSSLI